MAHKSGAAICTLTLRGVTHKSRLLGNRWLPQNVCGASDLLPPSPPAEKATARQDQTGETGTDKGAVGGVVPTSVPALIVERGLPGIVLALGWFARRHPVGSARPHIQASLLSRS
jgi:hypothetical protein